MLLPEGLVLADIISVIYISEKKTLLLLILLLATLHFKITRVIISSFPIIYSFNNSKHLSHQKKYPTFIIGDLSIIYFSYKNNMIERVNESTSIRSAKL